MRWFSKLQLVNLRRALKRVWQPHTRKPNVKKKSTWRATIHKVELETESNGGTPCSQNELIDERVKKKSTFGGNTLLTNCEAHMGIKSMC